MYLDACSWPYLDGKMIIGGGDGRRRLPWWARVMCDSVCAAQYGGRRGAHSTSLVVKCQRHVGPTP